MAEFTAFKGQHRNTIPGGGVKITWDEVPPQFVTPGGHRPYYKEAPEEFWHLGRFWRVGGQLLGNHLGQNPWLLFDSIPDGPAPHVNYALAVEAYGPRPVRQGNQPTSEVQGAQTRWDQDMENILTIHELPSNLNLYYAWIPVSQEEGHAPTTLRSFEDLLPDVWFQADIHGLGEGVVIYRVNGGVTDQDLDMDGRRDGRDDFLSFESANEFVVRFNNPDVGGPVQFRFSQMFIAFGPMVAGWHKNLEKQGLTAPTPIHLEV